MRAKLLQKSPAKAVAEHSAAGRRCQSAAKFGSGEAVPAHPAARGTVRIGRQSSNREGALARPRKRWRVPGTCTTREILGIFPKPTPHTWELSARSCCKIRPRGAVPAGIQRHGGSGSEFSSPFLLVSDVPARRPPRGRRAAVVPAFRHDNGKLSARYQTSKIRHIFVRLPTKFGGKPSRYLILRIFRVFNGGKWWINTFRPQKILKLFLQLDWIFPSLCAKFQLQMIFFEGFRGGGPAGT